jgi:hypothetical protein
MARLRVQQLERVVDVAEVQVLVCIVVAPLVVVGCILAFVACRLASWVVEGALEACIVASLVVAEACILEELACMKALVVLVLACIEALVVVVLAYILVVVVLVCCILEEVASWVAVVYKLDALVAVVLVGILALEDRILGLLE